jgi:adenylate kinase
VNILLLGPQGSGKGTQAGRIASEYGIPHVSTGELFRAAVASGSELGRRVEPILESGQLVPDDLTIEVIRERLASDDARDGFVLDGFPRTMAQAEALDGLLSEIGRELDVVLYFQIDDEAAFERIRTRAEQERRTDDDPEVTRRRLEIYHRETEPLADYYRAKDILVPIRADRSIPEVWKDIADALERIGERAA